MTVQAVPVAPTVTSPQLFVPTTDGEVPHDVRVGTVEVDVIAPLTVSAVDGVVVPMPTLPVLNVVPSPFIPVPKIKLPMLRVFDDVIEGVAMSYPMAMLFEPEVVEEAVS